MTPEPGLTVGATIASRRTASTPCLCDGHQAGACRLVDQRLRGDSAVERIACRCGRVWTRILVEGYR